MTGWRVGGAVEGVLGGVGNGAKVLSVGWRSWNEV